MRTLVLALALLAVTSCRREDRDFRGNAGYAGAADPVIMSELRAGQGGEDATPVLYQENRWAVSEGQRMYVWFNCYGCHASGGGGGIGPSFRDEEWIYGHEPDDIYASIMQGRPDGMPAFRDRIDPSEAWKLVAYIRSIGKMTPKDTWSARTDNMAEASPYRTRTDSAGFERRIIH